jgi:nuclear pore complex protein Nup107
MQFCGISSVCQLLISVNDLVLNVSVGFASLSAARDLLLSLPPQVTSHAVSFGAEGPELVHFRHFFEVWDGFTGLGVVRTSEPIDPAQKLEALEWGKQYSVRSSIKMACGMRGTETDIEICDTR